MSAPPPPCLHACMRLNHCPLRLKFSPRSCMRVWRCLQRRCQAACMQTCQACLSSWQTCRRSRQVRPMPKTNATARRRARPHVGSGLPCACTGHTHLQQGPHHHHCSINTQRQAGRFGGSAHACAPACRQAGLSAGRAVRLCCGIPSSPGCPPPPGFLLLTVQYLPPACRSSRPPNAHFCKPGVPSTPTHPPPAAQAANTPCDLPTPPPPIPHPLPPLPLPPHPHPLRLCLPHESPSAM